jgi:hypothetical protein
MFVITAEGWGIKVEMNRKRRYIAREMGGSAVLSIMALAFQRINKF